MIIALIDEAVSAGARQDQACAIIGLAPSTLQRWRSAGGGEDNRHGPRTEPRNKLSQAERDALLALVNTKEYRDLSPKQIVPRLADLGRYLASESTVYRLLRAANQLSHRGPAAAPTTSRRPAQYVATGPNQVWSWDITYLRSELAGSFYYLYMIVDVWSRKIVSWEVHDVESGELATALLVKAITTENSPTIAVLHSDNGAPMKSATLKATLDRLGITPSYSRPRVSDDNPYSEALFRTLKYRPGYPHRPFKARAQARLWVEGFVHWYHHEHLHSAIGYVTPIQRHQRAYAPVLAARRHVYQEAKRKHPQRWGSRPIRAWSAPELVSLNPLDALRGEPLYCAAA
jgi:putative transposase